MIRTKSFFAGAYALLSCLTGLYACGGSQEGDDGSATDDPTPSINGGKANGSGCASAPECSSGLCAGGVCTSGPGPTGAVTTLGPQFAGSGPNGRPLTTGCGPDTADQCGGTCEQTGGNDSTLVSPPETVCFSGEGDLTPDDPSAVIEQVIEVINGKKYIHLRVTFDPSFVDNTYGVNAVGWNKSALVMPDPTAGGKPPKMGKDGHTFNDLVGSDHVELVLTDDAGNIILDFDVDYVSEDASSPCGYASLGVLGGEGEMIVGDASAVVSVATSIDRNLNGCGYCMTLDSPVTDANFSIDPSAPSWDYRVIYEVWIAYDAFESVGFGGAYMPSVHASPSKAASNTLEVVPTPCPPDWDTPYCPPSIIEEGGNCFGTPPGGGGGPCPEGYVVDVESEGQECVPAP
jgi:hypothetical protein